MFCDSEHKLLACSDNKPCHCVHRLKVKINSIVEITVIDDGRGKVHEVIDNLFKSCLISEIGALNHPFHLHGHQLVLMNMGQFPNDTPLTDKLTHKMLTNPKFRNESQKFVNKDTFSVPSNGFVVFRFKADNPGWWLLHCHFGKEL